MGVQMRKIIRAGALAMGLLVVGVAGSSSAMASTLPGRHLPQAPYGKVMTAAQARALPGVVERVVPNNFTRSQARNASSGNYHLAGTASITLLYLDGFPLCAYAVGTAQATPGSGLVIEQGSFYIDGANVGDTDSEAQGYTAQETACVPFQFSSFLSMDVFGSAKWFIGGGRSIYLSVNPVAVASGV